MRGIVDVLKRSSRAIHQSHVSWLSNFPFLPKDETSIWRFTSFSPSSSIGIRRSFQLRLLFDLDRRYKDDSHLLVTSVLSAQSFEDPFGRSRTLVCIL